DILDKLKVKDIFKEGRTVINEQATVQEVREWLANRKDEQQNYYVVANDEGVFKGIVSGSNLFSMHHATSDRMGTLIKRKPFAIADDDSLKTAVEIMARENLDVLPVIASKDSKI